MLSVHLFSVPTVLKTGTMTDNVAILSEKRKFKLIILDSVYFCSYNRVYCNVAKEKTSDSYDRIVKNTGLLGGVQGIVVVVNIVRTKLVSMLLGPTGFGITESFNRTLNLVKSTTDLGVPFSAVKTVSE